MGQFLRNFEGSNGSILRNFDGLDEFIFKDILLERNTILLTTSLHSNRILHLFTLDKLKQKMNVIVIVINFWYAKR